MSGRIIAINYDQKDFLLSPCVEEYEAYETSEAIVIEGISISGQFNEFVMPVSESEVVESPELPDGNYTMNVSLRGSAEEPVVVFEFQNNNTGAVYLGVTMNQYKFVSDYMQAAAGMSALEMDAFEIPWSIEYLKGVFAGKLNASDGFWYGFNGDLDVALVPVNLQMRRAQQGQVPKLIEVDISAAELVIKM